MQTQIEIATGGVLVQWVERFEHFESFVAMIGFQNFDMVTGSICSEFVRIVSFVIGNPVTVGSICLEFATFERVVTVGSNCWPTASAVYIWWKKSYLGMNRLWTGL